MATVSAPAAGLQFRLLGPLEVWRDGRPLRLIGERQRGLLAALLLNANSVVSAERLIEDLYGSDPSGTAANALQAAVFRLRRQLGDVSAGDPSVITTRGRGYLLEIGSDQLDLALFEQLLGRGRELLAADEPAAASAILADALALWRGDLLADLSSLEFVQASARRVHELRLTALMDRLESDLRAGRSVELVPELEALVRENPLHERLRGQLMLALYRSGRQADALAVFRDTRRFLLEELGLEPSRELQRLERAILTHDEALDTSAERTLGLTAPDLCPFKGLAPFEIADAAFFCGRERVVADVVSLLASASFAGIIGASGIGKSSILRAGVLRSVTGGALPGSERWRLALLRPGERPLHALTRALGGEPHDVLSLLPPDGRVVVAVDQLEEVFSPSVAESERREFLELLLGLAADPAARAAVVLTVRADFYARCAEVPDFGELLSRRHVLVGPMARPEVERAIELPAARAGIEVERELTDALLADVEGRTGGLPLLSTMLLELWRRRDGGAMRLAAYRDAGGVHGAVARLAEQAFAELTAPEQEAARALFLRLALGEGDGIVRRRVPLEELAGTEDAALATVIQRLVAARLLTVDEGAVEAAHEAVLREWPRVRQWLDEDVGGRRLHAHLARSARAWEEGGRDAGDLLRGARLAAALDWAAAHHAELNRSEEEFLRSSRLGSERNLRRLRLGLASVSLLLLLAVAAGGAVLVSRAHARQEATVALAGRLGAEAVSEPRIDRAMLLAREAVRLHDAAATEGTLLSTLLRSPSLIATFTGPLDSRPQRLAVAPDGRSVAVSDNQATVRFYDVAARKQVGIVRRLGFGSAMTYAVRGGIFVAPGGLDNDPVLDVRDAHTRKRIGTLPFDRRFLTHPTGFSPEVVLSADARTAYYAYPLVARDGVTDGPAYVDRWDVRTRRLVANAAVGAAGSYDLKLVDGGRRLAVAGTTQVTFLDPVTLRRLGSVPLPRHSGGVVLSPTGREAALAGSAGGVSFVDLETGQVQVGDAAHAAPVSNLAFSPSGRLLVTGAEDGSLIVWDARQGRAISHLYGHGGRVLGIAFGHDDTSLFSCSLDGAIFEWDLGRRHGFGRPFGPPRSGTLPRLTGDTQYHPPPLAVAPDSGTFALRVGTNRIGLVSAGSGRRVATFTPGVGPEVAAIAWGRGGRLAVTGDAGRIRLWDVAARPHPLRALGGLGSRNGEPEVVTAVAFSGDGHLVAAGDVNHTPQQLHYRFGTVAVWDAASGRVLWRLRSRRGTVDSLAFSPDGATLAVGYEDGTVALDDARTGRLERRLRLEGGGNFAFETLAFSPSGILATGTWAGIVQLWNPRTGIELGKPTLVAAAPVASISFDSSGSTFATSGGSDGLVKLWTTSTLQQFAAPFPGDPGQWGSVRFTADGKNLVVVYEDQSGFVWPTSLRAWEQHACAVAHRQFTHEEWLRFVGRRPYASTC